MLTAELEAHRVALLSACLEARRTLRESRRALSALNNQDRYEARMHEIASRIAEKTGVPVDRMQSTSRYRSYVRAREEAMLAIRQETGATYDLIGAFFHRDHGTVMEACRRATERLRVSA